MSLLQGSQHLQDLAYSHPERNRIFGGEAHNQTVQWIYDTLVDTGYYDLKFQSFARISFTGNAILHLDGVETPAGMFTYTPGGAIQGEVIPTMNLGCDVSDFSSNVTNQVALISRGSCPFADKVANAKKAGAAAAIIYDNIASEDPAEGTLSDPGDDFVPVVGVTKAIGESLIARFVVQPVIAYIQLSVKFDNRTSSNVIAETKTGDHDNVLALGAHSDSVGAGPGINDDGSGTVALLEVAKALSQFSIRNAVRFCFWTAEEVGLVGSEHYVQKLNESQAEVDKVRAYLNFDMVASPNYINAIYDGDGSAFNRSGPAGSAEIEHNFERFYVSQGQASVPTPFDGRSDYGPFLEVGIASGGIFSGAEEIMTDEQARLFGGVAGQACDPCYHKACDNMTNLNDFAYLLNARAVADAVATYALSFDSLGPRPDVVRRERDARTMKAHALVQQASRPCSRRTRI